MAQNKIAMRRQQDILNELYSRGEVQVNELSEKYGVNPITIRRDLDALASRKLLDRVHGGAVISRNQLNEFGFDEKSVAHREAKRRIAERAASYIEDDSTVFLNSGSTTAEVINYIKDKRVRVVTNNSAISTVDYDPNIELYLSGGIYRPSSKSLVGDMALNSLDPVFSSCTILGANGLSVDQGMTTSVQAETAINRKMIEQTHGLVILAVDSSKLGVVSSFQTTELDVIDIIISDTQADPEFIEKLQKVHKKVVLV